MQVLHTLKKVGSTIKKFIFFMGVIDLPIFFQKEFMKLTHPRTPKLFLLNDICNPLMS